MPETLSFEEIIEKDGYLVYTNKGYSMYPMLRQHKDLLVISRKPEGRRKKNDVVLFKRNGKYILHRIVRVNENSYDIAGDHNWWEEKDVKEEEIIGVLTSFVRDGRKIPVDDKRYKAYITLWCGILRPVRNELIRAKAMIRRKIRHE